MYSDLRAEEICARGCVVGLPGLSPNEPFQAKTSRMFLDSAQVPEDVHPIWASLFYTSLQHHGSLPSSADIFIGRSWVVKRLSLFLRSLRPAPDSGLSSPAYCR